MQRKTHHTIGALSGMALGAYIAPGDVQVMAICTGIGFLTSMLPDELECNGLLSHRGITHAMWIPAALVALAQVAPFPIIYAYAIVLGYTSHLAADACTISGIRPFYPFKVELHLLPKPSRITTGTQGDRLIMLLALCALVYLAYLNGGHNLLCNRYYCLQ